MFDFLNKTILLIEKILYTIKFRMWQNDNYLQKCPALCMLQTR